MSLPAFLSRIHNAAGPLLGAIAESDLGERLESVSLALEIDERQAADPGRRAGYLLAVNLAARLYPSLALEGPAELLADARDLARQINPACEFGPARERRLVLSWRGGEPGAERVTLNELGWQIELDGSAPASEEAAAPASMAAAALGIGELFRALFADRLPHGRTGPDPFSLDWLTLGDPAEAAALPATVDLGTVHLAGCGAIGQAAVATLGELPVTGTLVAVDHETLDEGNLQRYLLSAAADVGASKTALIERALAGQRLTVEPVPTRWGADERSAPGRETVLGALDTKQGRIELQAGLPGEIFNAWTQPEDIGVSRHQAFGEDPCLACLGWPQRPRPSQSERIAAALGEGELRVLRYLLSATPVGRPLEPREILGTRRLPLPEDAEAWAQRSLLADLVERFGLPSDQAERLAGLDIRGLYRDAVCAGMLLERGGDSEAQVSVPLAHQSALAGIALATWLFVDRVPALAELRPPATQARYDVLRGGDQVWPRTRERLEVCLCADPEFLEAYGERWSTTGQSPPGVVIG
jgi:hypothetical protein